MYTAVKPPNTKIVNPVLRQFSVVVCILANSINACQGVLFSSDYQGVDEARSECFVKKKKDLESKRMRENMMTPDSSF